MITKEAIEAAAKELLAHGEFGTSDGANRRNAVVAAEAALTAAFAAMPGPAVKVEYASRTTGGFYPSSALTPATDLAAENERLRAFKIGDIVKKRSGSWWEGRVVGFYSTEQTPDGVCVQLDKPMGPVQIYPAAALERK